MMGLSDHPCSDRREFLATGVALMAPRGWLRSLVQPAGALELQRSWIPSADATSDIAAHLSREGVAAISLAVVEDGLVNWSRAFGSMAAGEPDPATPDTVFEAASLSKPILAYAVLGLVHAGAIDLDRPLIDYVSADDLVVDPRARAITARHVLSHRTGLPNWRFGAEDTLRLAFDPGTSFGYSGEGYYWLQRVVERVTETPFARYAAESILRPLGMASSWFTWSSGRTGRLAKAHDESGVPTPSYNERLGRQFEMLAERWGIPLEDWTHEEGVRALRELDIGLAPLPNFMLPNAAGSLLATAADYGRFVAHLFSSSSRLGPETTRAMWTSHGSARGRLHWGLGWGLETVGERRFVWHWGDNVFFKAFVVAEPAAGRAIVAFTNGQRGERVYRPIVRSAVELELEALNGV